MAGCNNNTEETEAVSLFLFLAIRVLTGNEITYLVASDFTIQDLTRI